MDYNTVPIQAQYFLAAICGVVTFLWVMLVFWVFAFWQFMRRDDERGG